MYASVLILTVASVTASPPQDALYDFYATWCGPCQQMHPIVDNLKAQGYPVIKVNIDERPDLKQQFGISQIPAFVLVVGGTVRQQRIGIQSDSTLLGMLAQIPRRQQPAQEEASQPRRRSRPLPVHLAEDEVAPKPTFNFSLPLPSFGKKEQVVQIDSPSSASSRGTRDDNAFPPSISQDAPLPPAAPGRASDSADEPAPSDSGMARLLAASVRIRVKDSEGAYFGSGVVIQSAPRRSYVLTCGHLLRDANQESRVEVDVFDGKRSRTYRGKIVKFDMNADVGLLAISTAAAIPSCPVAELDEAVRAGDAVVSIGCSNGEPPTVEASRVTMLNRYEGPDTIECTGIPAQGRSGGGLFTARGCVVGVCTNADPHEKKGVYAGLKPVLQLVQRANLDLPAPGSSRKNGESLAEGALDNPHQATGDDSPASPVQREIAHQREVVRERDLARELTRERELAQLGDAQGERSSGGASRNAAEAAESNRSPKIPEDVEVICIIRPVHHTEAESRVVIINRAGPKFLSYLTGEKDHLVPTMSASRRTRSADDAMRGDDVPNGDLLASDGRDSHRRTTAAWKPSLSNRLAQKPTRFDDPIATGQVDGNSNDATTQPHEGNWKRSRHASPVDAPSIETHVAQRDARSN